MSYGRSLYYRWMDACDVLLDNPSLVSNLLNIDILIKNMIA